MIKKVVIALLVVIMLIFLVGCLDYKAYDVDDTPKDEASLIDEIAQIEDEVAKEGVVEEEVVLPELDEVVEETSFDELDVVQVKENDLVKLNVEITDPDNDTVTHTFSKPLNQAGEWKTNYGDAGEYVVTISATDGQLTTEKKLKIEVLRVNVPPVIANLKDIVINEGEVVNFEPKVSDPNKDPVTVTVSEPLKNGIFRTDHTSAGEYQIMVSASDGELDSEASFKLTVNDVNVLPEISGLSDLTVKEGDVVEIKPQITDLDGDEITLTISDPVGNDGVWETKYTDHGDYIVTITANDGKDKVVKQINLVVEDVNMAPEIVGVSLN